MAFSIKHFASQTNVKLFSGESRPWGNGGAARPHLVFRERGLIIIFFFSLGHNFGWKTMRAWAWAPLLDPPLCLINIWIDACLPQCLLLIVLLSSLCISLHYNWYHFTLFSCYFVIWKFVVQLDFGTAKLTVTSYTKMFLTVSVQTTEWQVNRLDKPFKTDFINNCRNNFRTVEVKWVKEMFSLTLSGYRCHFAEQKRDRFVAWDWCPWFKHIWERQQT